VPRILLVEDNADLAEAIAYHLELDGYDVRIKENGDDAVTEALAIRPDLIILDIMLPGLNGFQVLERVRDGGLRSPVLILTARGEEADKVRGFKLDADQFVTKPVGVVELLERVRTLLRRARERSLPSSDDVLEFGNVRIDVRTREVERDGRPVTLTPRAFDLLVALARQNGRVVTRQDLLRDVWGHRGAVTTRTVDSHVSELRQKLEPDPANPRFVLTVYKIGYRFQA
jgi:two-component system response regulator MtrA